jgi:hypothetical protein
LSIREQGITIAQVRAPDDTNEITQAGAFLDALPIPGNDPLSPRRLSWSNLEHLATSIFDLWGARALISTALVDIDEGNPENAMDLYEQAQQVFITLNSEVDVCRAFVVKSRIYAAMGSEMDAATALAKARDLGRGLGRDETFIEQLLTDTGPDV